jgi:hypothetical protein
MDIHLLLGPFKTPPEGPPIRAPVNYFAFVPASSATACPLPRAAPKTPIAPVRCQPRSVVLASATRTVFGGRRRPAPCSFGAVA